MKRPIDLEKVAEAEIFGALAISSGVPKRTSSVTFPPGVPISIDPDRMSGAPCFEGTRVPVDSLFKNLESGLSLNEYLDSFPDVRREQAVAVLEYARKLALKAA
jgi:uncharacterized protein (DUF433 family)